ncbi:MAG: ribulokinase [Spirochaeta sp.]
MNYVIGLDFGTDSVRAVVVDASSGKTVGQAVEYYPRWTKGLYCDPVHSRFRQHPLDYIESLEAVIIAALTQCPAGSGQHVKGISVDTTGSTPVFTDKDGVPLGLQKDLQEDPDALFILWKDHTSIAEAAEINRRAGSCSGSCPTKYVGGIYSSEWFWAKALHVLRSNKTIAERAVSMVEHCDWIPALLTGTQGLQELKRSRCAAGHKILWHQEFGGYPDKDFFADMHPKLGDLVESLGTETWTSDTPAGVVSAEWARRLGISTDCVIGVGAFDAHMGAVGAGVGAYQLAKVIGTSTCDVLVAPPPSGDETVVRGICGQVDGSVIPGMIGYEAGQSAFGDAYAWFKNLLMWPLTLLKDAPESESGVQDPEQLQRYFDSKILPGLESESLKVDPASSGVLALDWLNGRRTPDADQSLRGGVMGLKLGTDAPRMYRALVEATAYGARAITERFQEQGIDIQSVVALGGISQKSAFVMQTVADVLNMEIEVSAAEQAGALGAAMFAATAAGLYDTVQEAQTAMSAGVLKTYTPDPGKARVYDGLYRKYKEFGALEERFAKEQ